MGKEWTMQDMHFTPGGIQTHIKKYIFKEIYCDVVSTSGRHFSLLYAERNIVTLQKKGKKEVVLIKIQCSFYLGKVFSFVIKIDVEEFEEKC